MLGDHQRPRVYKAEGVVLKQSPLGEADRLVTLYTASLGKLRAVARGARRPRSRLGGHLEPLSHVRLVLARGRSLDYISAADTVESFPALRDNLDSLARALVCAELLDASTPDESPNPPLLDLLLEALAYLERAQGDLLLWYYAFHVLRLAGYMPELTGCVACGAPVEPGSHAFSPGLGGVMCMPCVRGGRPEQWPPAEALPISVNALKLLRHFRGNRYREVGALRVPPGLLREVGRLLEAYFRHVLERDVRSPAFLAALGRLPRR